KYINSSFEDLIFGNFITSVTVVFVNKQLSESMEKWILKYPYGDWETYLWVIHNGGKIHFLNDVTAVYRKDFGISTALRKKSSTSTKINLEILKDMYQDNSFKEKRNLIGKSILEHK